MTPDLPRRIRNDRPGLWHSRQRDGLSPIPTVHRQRPEIRSQAVVAFGARTERIVAELCWDSYFPRSQNRDLGTRRAAPVPLRSPPELRVPPVPRNWGPGMEASHRPNFWVGVFSHCMNGQRIRYQETGEFHSPGLQQFPASALPVDGRGDGAF
jgi:hypothetical protein